MDDATPALSETIEIAAPLAQVWALVGDLRRMPEWSPDVTSVRLRTGFDEVALGTKMTHANRIGQLEWVTRSEVTAYEPEREIAFRVEENWVVWSFRLTPSGDGTLLEQRRDLPEGLSQGSREWTERYLGGQEKFTAHIRAGMRETLARIKSVAEA